MATGFRACRSTWGSGFAARVGTPIITSLSTTFAARWSEHTVHESIECRGRVEKLRGELLHYPYRNVSEHLAKIDRYTTLVAEQWAAEGRRSSAWQALVYPRLAFLRNYILRGGFRDGAAGLLVSKLNSYYVFLKYVKLFEMQRLARRSGASAEATASEVQPRVR